MRTLVLMLAVVTGCAVDAQGPDDSDSTTKPDMMSADAFRRDTKDATAVDVCGLASALPTDDICHYVCDPTEMAAQLEASGADRGACYQLYCQLTEADHVIAGVCLAP